MIGHFAFLGFLTLWNPSQSLDWPEWRRYLLGGLAGGAALLLDYSGVVFLLGLFCYAAAKAWQGARWDRMIRLCCWYVAGTLPPILLLWFYQWRSFGNPFLPGQHWMPPVAWIENGYQGFTLPQIDLLSRLLFDYRYGLFVTCPLFLLALLSPKWNSSARRVIPQREFLVFLALPLALVLFCGGISYTRLQFNTGTTLSRALAAVPFRPRGNYSHAAVARVSAPDSGCGGDAGVEHGHVPRRGARLGRAGSRAAHLWGRLSDSCFDRPLSHDSICGLHRRGRIAVTALRAGGSDDLLRLVISSHVRSRGCAHRNR